MTYIVWDDNGFENWGRSGDLETMADCFDYIRTQIYGHPYVITKPVFHELVEINYGGKPIHE